MILKLITAVSLTLAVFSTGWAVFLTYQSTAEKCVTGVFDGIDKKMQDSAAAFERSVKVQSRNNIFSIIKDRGEEQLAKKYPGEFLEWQKLKPTEDAGDSLEDGEKTDQKKQLEMKIKTLGVQWLKENDHGRYKDWQKLKSEGY